MELKEAERVVIAKPVPLRPSCSGFRPFTELLVDSVDVSPPNSRHETVVAAIRPKTVRFRPTGKTVAPAGFAGSRGEVSAKENDKASGERGLLDSKSYVIYKPKAKVVSKATVSILANMEKFGVNQQQPLKQTKACVQNVSQDRWNFQNQLGSDLPQKVPSFVQGGATTSSETLTGDRSSQDGYHWRKYGQKQVKGSEFPRGYFRCTYPNCPVKKKVERSCDGQISEIVYQGEHNHPKPCPPPPPRRSSSNGPQKLGLVSEGSFGQDPKVHHSLSNRLNERNDVSESRAENRNGVGVTLPSEFVAFGATSSAAGTSDSCCPSGECDESGKELDGEVHEPRTKRRKTESRSNDAGVSEESSGEPRGQPRSSVDSEALEDGFRWRKYGQKVVRGNPFPRSYYKCTSRNCGARKHVERASDDPRALITTYEGKHNHQIPSRTTHVFSSQEDSK